MTGRVQRLGDGLADAVRRHAETGKPVRVPDAGTVFWSLFLELSNARTVGPRGPNPIQFSEMEAWARLKRWPLCPHHVDLITAMDAAWLGAVYSKRPDVSCAPATPAALDAMFEAAGW